MVTENVASADLLNPRHYLIRKAVLIERVTRTPDFIHTTHQRESIVETVEIAMNVRDETDAQNSTRNQKRNR